MWPWLGSVIEAKIANKKIKARFGVSLVRTTKLCLNIRRET